MQVIALENLLQLQMANCGSVPASLSTLTVALLSGTGRMGVHLAAAWAHAGIDVLMCSRSKEKAQAIVSTLLSGNGYVSPDGQVQVSASSTAGWKLRAGSEEDAASADVMFLSTAPFEAVAPQLLRIAPLIRGKGKIIIDITNPWVMGNGVPPSLPQASVQVIARMHGTVASPHLLCT